MKRLLLITICILFFLKSEKKYAQDAWIVELGVSLTGYKREHAVIIGDYHLLQTPRFSVSREINDKLSADFSSSISFVGDLGVLKNWVTYSSLNFSLRYELYSSKFLNPYVSFGGGIANHQVKNATTLNLGLGNKYWFSENYGINTQFIYKISDPIFSHWQISLGLMVDLSNINITRSRLWRK
jgi:hypothetical protein